MMASSSNDIIHTCSVMFKANVFHGLADYIKEKSDCKVFIWFGDCFGACDFPLGAESLGIDLIIQFGHSI